MFILETVIFLVLIIIVLFPSLKYVRKQIHIEKCLKHLPGPKIVFFFGNVLEFLGNQGKLEVFLRWYKEHGTIIKGRFGPIHNGLLVSDYRFMKKFLLANKNLTKGRMYEVTKNWLGNGLLTSEENEWRGQRKILAPAFSSNLLMDFISIFDEQGTLLVEKLKENTINSVDIQHFLSLCSLAVICGKNSNFSGIFNRVKISYTETTMGVSINGEENYDDYVKSMKNMCEIFAKRTMSLWKILDILFIFFPEFYEQKKSLKIIHSSSKKIIAARKKKRYELGKCESGVDDVGSKRKLALLDVLLEHLESGKITEKDVEDQVHTFMFAGHDSVTAAMSFLIYELSKNPDIQELAFQEQKSLFGNDPNAESKFKDIQEMKYLDALIKETLRMYPPVSIIGRLVSEDFEFDNDVIPEGTLIVFFIYALHRNPELFPNPDTFDPSRFENPDTVDPFSFLPFSTGPRNCIGHKFAMYEMKVIISKLLRNFKFSPADPPHTPNLRAEIVLTSKNGVKVKISHRN